MAARKGGGPDGGTEDDERGGLLGTMFRSLAVRNFRVFVLGQLGSVVGTWMMVVAQDWLVLGLTGDSGTALGTVTACQFAPLLLLTLYAGGLADRHDKRRLLVAANLAAAALSLVLAALVLTDAVRLWHVYVLALALGTVNAVETPTRMSFVSELVGARLLPNASALSGAYFNVARVVGPALAGLLISRWDTGPVMLLNAVSYLATVAGLRLVRPGELHRSARRPGRASVGDGIRHVRARRDLLLPMALVAAVGVTGFSFQAALPLLAKTVLRTDAEGFGLLTTALAAGSLTAALATTARRGRPPFALVLGSALVLGTAVVLTGLGALGGPVVPLLFCTGLASTAFAQAANHHIQLGTDPAFRGRVTALYTLVSQGTTPLTALLTGTVAELYGVRSALVLGGTGCVLAALAAAAPAAYGRLRRRPADPPGGEPEAPPTPGRDTRRGVTRS
ncbi:MFS transporter [Streptomyces sp. NPDC088915]|uniref:MFS transporter n=1 Tax=Streptomyces sp. NPDC088915 TaxID=3365912 RepID=UPI00382E9507